jgi:hypothetical protein
MFIKIKSQCCTLEIVPLFQTTSFTKPNGVCICWWMLYRPFVLVVDDGLLVVVDLPPWFYPDGCLAVMLFQWWLYRHDCGCGYGCWWMLCHHCVLGGCVATPLVVLLRVSQVSSSWLWLLVDALPPSRAWRLLCRRPSLWSCSSGMPTTDCVCSPSTSLVAMCYFCRLNSQVGVVERLGWDLLPLVLLFLLLTPCLFAAAPAYVCVVISAL